MSTSITVVTYNLWGIFNAEYRKERMAHFATKVAQYDVILLQELFSLSDYELIVQSLPEEVRASRYIRRFPTAFYGSGVAVISRYPITSTFFSVFPLQGFPERLLHGDYYANKGAALVRINVPCATGKANESLDGSHDLKYREVFLYTSHFVAAYEKTAKLRDWRHELYLPIRLSQAVSFANFVAETSRPTDSVVIGGDLNATQGSLEVQTILTLLRQRGYQFRSALPPLKLYNVCKQGEKESPCALMSTYSDKNMFNSTKGGFFVEGGDVPCQIDHIFYTSNTLRLCLYDDCPNASPDYPFTVQNGDEKSPVGVVVFTRNDEVRLTTEKGYLARFADWVRTQGNLRGSQGFVTIADWISPKGKSPLTGGKQKSVEKGEKFCALSDHYGVAVRLELYVESSETDAIKRGAAPNVLLTEKELRILREATRFLGDTVKQLRYESKICIFLSCASFAAVFGSILFSMYLQTQREHQRGLLLERLFSLAELQKVSPSDSMPREGSMSVPQVLKRWIEGLISLIPFTTPRNNAVTSTSIPMPSQDGDPLYHALMASFTRGNTLSLVLTPLFAVFGTFGGFAALLTGLLQRNADAKVVTEQVNTLPHVLPASSEEGNEVGDAQWTETWETVNESGSGE